MKAALVLVDCQQEFLDRRPLEPSPEVLVARVLAVMHQWRAWAWPIAHVRLSVTRVPDNRLPHWKAAGQWPCVVGTAGHAFPDGLAPHAGEPVIDKSGFSGFESPALEGWLETCQTATVVVAGLYSHTCVRATALDAWRSGREVVVVEDAVGHYDWRHAESTRAFLSSRGVRYLPSPALAAALGREPGTPFPRDEEPACLKVPGRADVGASGNERPLWVHHSPTEPRHALWSMRPDSGEAVAAAVDMARQAHAAVHRASVAERHAWLQRLATALTVPETAAHLARMIALDVGKPITDARLEVARCVRLLEATQRQSDGADGRRFPDGSWMRRVPLGTVAVITPWNHPLAIAVGKLAPALRHGNSVVWKPAPAGSRLAVEMVRLIRRCGWPEGSVALVLGGEESARLVMGAPGIDGLTLTGGPAAGAAAGWWSMARHWPWQAELGGNNAAVVWDDADGQEAARLVAPAAFGFAGQRCTANRRVIVPRAHLEMMIAALTAAAQALPWGDPLEDSTIIGPMISRESRDRVVTGVAAAAARGHRVVHPLAGLPPPSPHGWFAPPAIVVCEDPADDIVQRESFGPVLVVQPSDGWDDAVALVNGVSQGLAASVFTSCIDRWHDFRDRVHAGIVKWNRATADAGVDAPFGGWKASGYGPPEHGPAQIEFFTRMQAIYED